MGAVVITAAAVAAAVCLGALVAATFARGLAATNVCRGATGHAARPLC